MRKVVLGLILVVAGGGALVAFRNSAATRDDAVAGLEVVRVVQRDVGAVVKATGVVRPRTGAQVRVGSRISGVVRRLYVQIGDRVEEGQLLADLDSTELVARRAEAAAALASARANLDFAVAERARKEGLRASGFVSESELDSAARAEALARAQLAEREAALAVVTTQLGYAQVRAPIAGVVASVSTQEGETVAASFATPTFVTLLDLSRLEVWAYVDETDIGRVAIGQAATFTVDTYSDEELEGQVTAIYPQAEIRDNVVNYVAVVAFDPPAGHVLRPEMTATVRIALETREDVLALPLRAVRWEDGHAFVALPATGGEKQGFVRRSVATGIRDESHWEIRDGLAEGDEVLVGELPTE